MLPLVSCVSADPLLHSSRLFLISTAVALFCFSQWHRSGGAARRRQRPADAARAGQEVRIFSSFPLLSLRFSGAVLDLWCSLRPFSYVAACAACACRRLVFCPTSDLASFAPFWLLPVCRLLAFLLLSCVVPLPAVNVLLFDRSELVFCRD